MGKVNQSNPRGRVNQIKEPPFPDEVVLSERVGLDGKNTSNRELLVYFQDYDKGTILQSKRNNLPKRSALAS
ncbi:hypothetical protein N9Z38_00705 [Mariniblastus sp.]|nr:hypothetical protein [Mariniblastus sp.]